MKQLKFLIFCFLLCIAGTKAMFAQKTYLYKRVMIVKNGAKTNKNDDAHYITFTDKGCYESDKDGFTTNNGFIKFTKNDWLLGDDIHRNFTISSCWTSKRNITY